MSRRRPVNGIFTRLALFGLFVAAFFALKGFLRDEWLAGERAAGGQYPAPEHDIGMSDRTETADD